MAIIRYVPIEDRYRTLPSGRLIPEASVRRAVDRVADEASERMADISRSLIERELAISAWQRQMMQLTKDAMIAGTVAGRGGSDQMTQADWGRVGRALRDQYDYLRRFALQIASGDQPADGRLVNRARLYGQQARVAYERTRARNAERLGRDEERNVLHPAEHCGECRELAALGWVDRGTLPEIGARTCLANCRCSIEHRTAPEAREAGPRLLRAI